MVAVYDRTQMGRGVQLMPVQASFAFVITGFFFLALGDVGTTTASFLETTPSISPCCVRLLCQHFTPRTLCHRKFTLRLTLLCNMQLYNEAATGVAIWFWMQPKARNPKW